MSQQLNINSIDWAVAASRVYSRENTDITIDVSGNSNNISFKNGNQNLFVVNNYNGSFNGNIVYFGNPTNTISGCVYYYDSSKNWLLANVTNAGQKLVGIAIGSTLTESGMLLSGQIMNSLYSSFTIGNNVYLSDVSGVLTTTQSTRPLGFVIDASSILISPYSLSTAMSGISGYGIATGAGTTGFTSSAITDPSSSLSYTLLTWTSTSGTNSMSVTNAGLFEIFVLGGGGGGGNNSNSGSGGGGGAGQLVKQTMYLPVDAYTIIVGAGGSVGVAGSGTGTRSAFRGGFSAICPTSPAYPKIVAVGGGGGMASSAGGGNAALNSYARCTWACDSYCGGGGASPQTNTSEVVEYSAFSPTNITSLNQIGFSDNTLTTGGFFGGTGYNNSNYSATGGGGGIGGSGGNYTQSGGQETMRGGAGGIGVTDGFSGSFVNYGGGGCGGHATNQAQQTSIWGGGSGSAYNGGSVLAATAGQANTGGGGGGGANQNLNSGGSGAGGSGIVMVRFRAA